MSSTPPRRSRPSLVSFDVMTKIDAKSRPATSSRTKRLRRRSVTGSAYSGLGRQDEQHAAVVVVRREQVGLRLGGQVALGVDLHRLVELADAPLEHGLHGVGAVAEAQAEDLARGPADDLLVPEAGELERAAPARDDAAVLVGDEEGGVRRRVVVVEQLEEEAEAAVRAALGLPP